VSTDGFTPAQLEQLRQIVREEVAAAIDDPARVARQFDEVLGNLDRYHKEPRQPVRSESL
jgi:cytochrome P450